MSTMPNILTSTMSLPPAMLISAEMVTDLLDAADKVTVEQAIEIAFSTQVWHAERWQARLKEAWQKAADADKTADIQEVYSLIQEWDRQSAPDSKGALAYYAFKKGLGGELAAQDRASREFFRRATARGPAQGGGVGQGQFRLSGGPVRRVFPGRPARLRPLVARRRRLAARRRHGHSAGHQFRSHRRRQADDRAHRSVVDPGRHLDGSPRVLCDHPPG